MNNEQLKKLHKEKNTKAINENLYKANIKLVDMNRYLKLEIERLKERIEDLNTINEEHQILNSMLRKEIERLNNIIKEVREYIESYMPNYDFDKTNLIKLLEILDKGE